MSYTQKNRPIKVKTPLGDDVLMLRAMSGSEELGRLSQFDLDLLSRDDQIKLEDVLGQNLTVELMLPDGETRYFNGIVSRFCQVGESGEFFSYQATLRPWFWLLTRTSDCRIFQEMTVPDIIKAVFRDNGFSDFEESLSGEYRTWEYCVQYRETDFNFVSRLMEQEGIYYYFVHEDGKHTLKLSDSISAHEPIATPDVPYYPPSQNVERDEDYIQDWFISRDLQPGAYSQRDFDFKNPKANLETKLANPFNHDKSDFEIYDYPGEYVTADEGNQYVRARLEELHAHYERMRGEGNVHGLYSGGLFNLTGYPRDDQNREYLVISASYSLQSNQFEAGGGGEGDTYSCRFEVMNSEQSFRATRITPKPMVQGPQTAIVVGPSGDEIYTDEFGRVKVQFHWDRYGENNENSSCWVRVSHPWAGKSWGSIALPRIGQEVIVSFIEGDPDRPIITGRVYNADCMPPYELPANATQSGVKSRSSKGGSGDNFNEIRLEDKKGSEEVYIHAEKDQNNHVENDETTFVGHDRTETVGNDETISIGNDRTEDVGNDETILIGNNRTETVGSNETISIGADRTEDVGSNETITIGSSRSVTIGSNKSETIAINKAETIGVAKELTIGGAYQVTVGAAMNETIGGLKAEEIGGIKSVNVGVNSSENIGGNKSVSAGKDISASAGKNISESAGDDVSVSAGKKMALTAGDDFAISGAKKGVIEIADELTIKVGKAIILMKKNGDITINGKKINVKASDDIVMKGKKILQN
ncbi:VgrG protein [hydrothermal vent metagenome]|uniref:VgrG protein n=1 Tax=hydrothermal vent metagenome TaxID=652676 RepID=A0A3B0Z0E5_9ZZZZ